MNKFRIEYAILTSVFAIVLLGHRSTNPYIFIYSLPYLVFLILLGLLAIGLFVLFAYFKTRAWFIIAAVTVPLLVLGAFVECAGHLYAWRYPSFDVLFLEPDRHIGWKQVPNFKYTWTGPGWAAFEFSVPVETNAAGFRDRERTFEKLQGVTRVALLGDSLVEALQVPLEQTAGGILEDRLNSPAAQLEEKGLSYEVLNFGISNFGVGQYLLTWRHHASKYKPDYVFAIVAEFHMRRAVSEFTSNSQGRRRLAVTPTFRWENGALVEQPAKDYEKFIVAQRQFIELEFGGNRVRRRPVGLVLWKVLDRVCAPLSSLQLNSEDREQPSTKKLTEPDIVLNLRILEELGKSVRADAGSFVIVDAVRFFNDMPDLSARLKKFCNDNEFGHVDLAAHCRAKSDNGIKLTWKYDGHFNVAGNETFAEALEEWLVKNESVTNLQEVERIE